MLKIGVLGVQGAVSEHLAMLQTAFQMCDLQGEAFAVRTTPQLKSCDGLVIPGGESTTISRLLEKNDWFGYVSLESRELELPILGTCAGMVLLASEGDKQVERTGQKLLGAMDFRVDRNFFGGQQESFQAPLRVSFLSSSFPGVFIRAPVAERVWGAAKAVCRYDGAIVGVQQGPHLALSFHPELSCDSRIHEYFIKKVLDHKRG